MTYAVSSAHLSRGSTTGPRAGVSPYDLNFRHLLAVSAIAEVGSVSRAAMHVHMSQPALTQALVKLEETLRQRLFDRKQEGMSPTPAGLELVHRIERATAELTRAFDHDGVRRSGDGRAMLRRIGFTHLRAVIAAVENGNFALATRAIGISAPAIHRAVRDFERIVNIRLFERAGRTIVPTKAAKVFVAAARRAIAEIEAGLADLSALRGESGGRVAVGALPLARPRLLPEAVSTFYREQPGVTVSIVIGTYPELFANLVGGELDILIGALRTPHPSPDVVQTPLYVDQLAVVGRVDHPLANCANLDMEALAAYPWIIAQRAAPVRVAWEEMFRSAGLDPPDVAVECNSTLTIHGLLFEGDWLTLISPEQVSREIEVGRLTTIGPPLAAGARTVGMTTRADWRPSAVQAAFLRHLKERAASRSPLVA